MYNNNEFFGYAPIRPMFTRNRNGAPEQEDEPLIKVLSSLIDPLETLDAICHDLSNKLMSNNESRRGCELEALHADVEREELMDELAVASTAALHLRAVLSLADELL